MSRSRACPTRGERITAKYEWLEGQPQSCHLCGIFLFSSQQWVEHMTEKHRRSFLHEGKYHCPFSACTRKMDQWANLRTHINRHLSLEPHQCPEMIEVPDPENPSSSIWQQCPVRETDGSSLNRHRVHCHGHQPQKRRSAPNDDNGEGSSNGQAVRRKRNAPFVRRGPMTNPNCRVLPFSEAFRSVEGPKFDFRYESPSLPESSSSSPAPSQANTDLWPSSYSSPSPPISTPSPTYTDSWPSSSSSVPSPDYFYSALSPASTDSWSSYSTPSPTFSGATSPSPSPSPSPPLLWDFPLPSYQFDAYPSFDNVTVVSPDEDPSWEQISYSAEFLSPEAQQMLNADLNAFAKSSVGIAFLS